MSDRSSKQSIIEALSRDDFRTHPDSPDFMANAFDRVGEPLNLLSDSQTWFQHIYLTHQGSEAPGHALVLGVTPWLGKLAAQQHQHVWMADRSAAMLAWAKTQLSPAPANCQFLEADWLRVATPPLSTVLGDNSLAFVPYPEGWEALCNRFHQACLPGARLYLRFFSVPEKFQPASTADLVLEALRHEKINYTAFRAAYLFSHWNAQTRAIDTALALQRFEQELEAFIPLAEKFGLPADNDLVTLRKYAGTGISLYAPSQAEITQLLGRHFRILEIAFAPTEMRSHFPLFVLEKDGA